MCKNQNYSHRNGTLPENMLARAHTHTSNDIKKIPNAYYYRCKMVSIKGGKWLVCFMLILTVSALMANNFYDSVFIPLVSYIQIVQLR